MTYDDTARQLGVKVIGTVESNLTWDSINYNDPITVGVAQWYGTRAAAILDRMKNENPGSWSGVAASIDGDLTNHTSDDVWWTTRFLNAAEGTSLQPVLNANQTLQTSQLETDLNGYADVARAQGMDVDANTPSFLFFATMYHQSPNSAFQVMANVGANASLDAYYAGAMNHPVLGQYPNRYTTAYNIILSGDASGVTAPPTTTTTTPGGSGGSTGGTRPSGPVSYVRVTGTLLELHGTDGSMTFAYPAGGGIYRTGQNPKAGAAPPPPTTSTPTDPPPTGTGTGDQLVAYMAAHANMYAYGQGPGRLQPDTSGYTDCSGMVYCAYMAVTGQNIGTWGGAQIKNGTLIATGGSTVDTSNLQPGDVVFYMWPGGDPVNYDHTAMYAGGGNVWSHGGPGNGPILTGITGFVITPAAIMVRRYI